MPANEHNSRLQTHAEGLQKGWDAANQQNEELCKTTARLETELATEQTKVLNLELLLEAANEHNIELQSSVQLLQNEQDTAKQRIEELSKSIGRLETELATEQTKVINLELLLEAANEHNIELQSSVQLLQNEQDIAKQRIEELSKSTGRLETELAAEQTKAINLSLELNAANEHNTQLQAHAQWLQNEWDAASAKVHELSHSSHHWWTVADQLSQEKQSIYSSKFWRISWPLRKFMQAAKWTMVLPVRTVRWTLRFPQRIAHRAGESMRLGLIANRNLTSITSHSSGTGSEPQKSAAVAVYPPNRTDESIHNLSPQVARIYTDLKKAIEARKN